MAANSQTPILRWEKMANGVWKSKVGKPETNNLLSISESKPKTSAINEMSSVAFPLSPNEIKFEIFDGKTYLRFPLEKAEKIFGLALNFKNMEQ